MAAAFGVLHSTERNFLLICQTCVANIQIQFFRLAPCSSCDLPQSLVPICRSLFRQDNCVIPPSISSTDFEWNFLADLCIRTEIVRLKRNLTGSSVEESVRRGKLRGGGYRRECWRWRLLSYQNFGEAKG